MNNLIVPLAADSPSYNSKLPRVFSLDDEGIARCIKSVLGLNLEWFDKIYFTILKKHDLQYLIKDTLTLQFKRVGITNASVVVLDEPTIDQAETVFQTIKTTNINGLVFIKDGDGFFRATVEDSNSVAIYPIEEMNMLFPKNKSYVSVDDMYYITNIIEKNVVGHFINAGGYCFCDSSVFCKYYEKLRHYGKLYLSHIIYAMLLDKISFRPLIVDDFQDWDSQSR